MPSLLLALLLSAPTLAWNFAVSGDSRNCGDVVMPAIAAGARGDGAAFFWHLGDFRWTGNVDEDILHQPRYVSHPPTLEHYRAFEWDDFIENQVGPFGKTPVYLGIGNHETIAPKTRAEYVAKFRPWRPADARNRSYYQWLKGGVAFINLDNATPDQFDAAQLSWFEATLKKDAADPKVSAIVVGMHEALPESISADHSMNQSPAGIESGRRVYADLLAAKAAKRVYVFASHSHYYLSNLYNTQYWRDHGGVLPGWLVGTAGAVRYRLPEGSSQATEAMTDVYGYLIGEVKEGGTIEFVFKRLEPKDVPAEVAKRYGADFVRWCFEQNRVVAP